MRSAERLAADRPASSASMPIVERCWLRCSSRAATLASAQPVTSSTWSGSSASNSSRAAGRWGGERRARGRSAGHGPRRRASQTMKPAAPVVGVEAVPLPRVVGEDDLGPALPDRDGPRPRSPAAPASSSPSTRPRNAHVAVRRRGRRARPAAPPGGVTHERVQVLGRAPTCPSSRRCRRGGRRRNRRPPTWPAVAAAAELGVVGMGSHRQRPPGTGRFGGHGPLCGQTRRAPVRWPGRRARRGPRARPRPSPAGAPGRRAAASPSRSASAGAGRTIPARRRTGTRHRPGRETTLVPSSRRSGTSVTPSAPITGVEVGGERQVGVGHDDPVARRRRPGASTPACDGAVQAVPGAPDRPARPRPRPTGHLVVVAHDRGGQRAGGAEHLRRPCRGRAPRRAAGVEHRRPDGLSPRGTP